MTKTLTKVSGRVIAFAAMWMLALQNVLAQKLDYSEVEGEVTKASSAGITIIETLIGVVLAIGLINAIYQVASGKHESRDKIVGWAIGVVLYIIGLIIVNKIVA
jgi:hypothetical protein